MNVLLDTGPRVALIDRSETKHEACVEWLKHFEDDFYSSEAVLTEVLWLLNFSSKAQSAALDFVIKGVVTLVPTTVKSLKEAKRLMKKYSDRPMDFADATLVVLAEEFGTRDILTFDHKDFNIYRIGKKGLFNIFP